MIVNSGARVDSYRSSLGAYGGANVGDHGDLQAAQGITINGGGVVHGRLYPYDPADLTPVPTPARYTNLGDLNIQGDYTFQAGNYLVDTLNCNGTPAIHVHGGQVRIWFNNLNLAGSVGLGADRPSDLILYSRIGAGQVNLNGGPSTFTGVIFAPNIPVNINGTGKYFGACIASRLVLNSSVAMHGDEDLGSGCANGCAGDLKSAEVRSVGKVGTGIGRYGLPPGRTLVAYPNPAKGRMTVVYRLETSGHLKLGLSDLTGRTVDIRDLGIQPRGINGVDWDLRMEAPGLYFVWATFDGGQGQQTLGLFKLAVLK